MQKPKFQRPGCFYVVVTWEGGRDAAPAPDAGAGRRTAKGRAVYPAVTQESFKLKWRPQHIEPEYLAFQRGVTPGAVWRLMRLTKAV